MSRLPRLPLLPRLPRCPGPLLVTLAACLWGTDALLRGDLSRHVPAATIVLLEHVALVAVTCWALPSGLRALRDAGALPLAAAVVLGIGSSAVATLMFTQAFAISSRTGDFVTPVLLQKVQPLVAIAAAAALLGERPRRSYGPFLAAGLVGIWLIAFPDPGKVGAGSRDAALLSLGAAVLWAAGTVLGRYLGAWLPPREITAVRFGFGLVGALVAVVVTGAPFTVGSAGQLGRIALLALVPGLLALLLYYAGLARTPAMVATLCELAFPLTATVTGVWLLDSPALTLTQVTGVLVVAGVVVVLSLPARSRAVVVAPAYAGAAERSRIPT